MKIPYFQPWITNKDKQFVLKSLNSRWLTNGPFLKKFENQIEKFVGTKHAIGVSTATHGLHLCLRSIGISSNDEVIVPTMTFASTSDVVKYCGAKPILVDVEKDTLNISTNEIKKNITKKTKAVIVVHYGRQSCDMSEIILLAKKNNLKIIEDCAHALGSTYKNKKCGSLGDAGCFSFYPTKVIQTGEGGMITTNNKSIFKKSILLRSHGMTKLPKEREQTAEWKYDIDEIGYNYRLNELSSSLGYSQSFRIKKINNLRIKIAKYYDKHLEKIKGIEIPIKKPDRNHIFHLYTIKINKEFHMTRDQLFTKLNKHGIGASVQYTPLHLMTYNKGTYKHSNFPNSNELHDQIISLPIFPKMSEKQLKFIISIFK